MLTLRRNLASLMKLLIAFTFATYHTALAQDNKAVQPTSDEFSIPVDEQMAGDIDRMIADLGSPSYEERTAATDGLVEIGAPAFARLRDAYRTSDDFEVRLRIERIVFSSYLDHHVYSRHAFLGISLQPFGTQPTPGIELPPNTRGVSITNVIEDTAAERAGLLKNDVIIGADGSAIEGTAVDVVTSFSQSIAARRPGARMTLTVAREDGMHEIEVTLGRCPRERVQQTRIREKYDTAAEQFRIWWKRFFASPVADGE